MKLIQLTKICNCRRVCGLPDKAGGPEGLHPGGAVRHPAMHHPSHRHPDGHRLRVQHTGQHPPGEREDRMIVQFNFLSLPEILNCLAGRQFPKRKLVGNLKNSTETD